MRYRIACLAFAMSIALAPFAGPAAADGSASVPDAGPDATAEGGATTLTAPSDGFASSGERCSCEGHSPAKLLETRQELEPAATEGEPGDAGS